MTAMGHKRERRPRRRPASHAAGVPQLAGLAARRPRGVGLGPEPVADPFKVRGIGIALLPSRFREASAMKFGRREFLHLAAGTLATAKTPPSIVLRQSQTLQTQPS